MGLPPILYHYFSTPLPYIQTLALQEAIHNFQLSLRHSAPSKHRDILLLLEHRPVYTAGRRQASTPEHERELIAEETRLKPLGADFVRTKRGGQLTYHGPGQMVGYPLLDLSAGSGPPLSIRDYICRLQKMIEEHFSEGHGIPVSNSEHTGVFLDEKTKVGSIGVQVRHRLTTHGFAFNVTREPLAWFDEIVACGLADVKAGCIQSAGGKERRVSVAGEVQSVVDRFGKRFGRDMERMELGSGQMGEVEEIIAGLEQEAREAGDWTKVPHQTTTP